MAPSIVVCAVGYKGAVFLRLLSELKVPFEFVYSYDQPDDLSASFDKIRLLTAGKGATFEVNRRPTFSSNDLIFVVGWQYLLHEADHPAIVVFHDFLLPKYRGFAPTVTALVNGDDRIGVTALRPTKGVDEGPIYAQASLLVKYPMKVACALEQQANLMAQLAAKIAHDWRHGKLMTTSQDNSQASYSLWRDERDLMIDWSRDANEIVRLIDACGFPYLGARTIVENSTIVVDDATVLPDRTFEIRAAGKIWSVENGAPVVVCGAGMLRLDRCRTIDGVPVTFERLRTRLGS